MHFLTAKTLVSEFTTEKMFKNSKLPNIGYMSLSYGLETLENKSGHGKVVEFLSVMNFNVTNFAFEFHQICAFLHIKKFSLSSESLHFPSFSAMYHKCKI